MGEVPALCSVVVGAASGQAPESQVEYGALGMEDWGLAIVYGGERPASGHLMGDHIGVLLQRTIHQGREVREGCKGGVSNC